MDLIWLGDVPQNFQMMNGFWFVPVREETAERKKRRACGNKVKIKNDSNDED
jgi:hypothetical protein